MSTPQPPNDETRVERVPPPPPPDPSDLNSTRWEQREALVPHAAEDVEEEERERGLTTRWDEPLEPLEPLTPSEPPPDEDA